MTISKSRPVNSQRWRCVLDFSALNTGPIYRNPERNTRYIKSYVKYCDHRFKSKQAETSHEAFTEEHVQPCGETWSASTSSIGNSFTRRHQARTHLHDAFKTCTSSRHLLKQLRALCETRGLPEVVRHEHFCSPLRCSSHQLRAMNLHESLSCGGFNTK